MSHVTHVRVLDDCCLRVRFAHGREGLVCLADLVGKGVFASLADPDRFAQVGVDPDTHTLAWPGGVGTRPDTLYEDLAADAA